MGGVLLTLLKDTRRRSRDTTGVRNDSIGAHVEVSRLANKSAADADAKRHFKLDTSCRHSHWHPDNIKRRNKEKALEEKRARLVARQVTKPPRFRRSHALAHPLMGGFLAREVYGPIGPATSSAGPQGFLLSDLETSGFLPSTLGAGDQSPPRGQGERGGGVIPSEAGGIRSMRIQTPVPRGKIALPSRSLIVGGMTTAGRIPGLDRDFQNAVLAENFRPKGEFNFCSGHSHDGLFSNIPCFWVSGYEERLGMGIVYASMCVLDSPVLCGRIELGTGDAKLTMATV